MIFLKSNVNNHIYNFTLKLMKAKKAKEKALILEEAKEDNVIYRYLQLLLDSKYKFGFQRKTIEKEVDVNVESKENFNDLTIIELLEKLSVMNGVSNELIVSVQEYLNAQDNQDEAYLTFLKESITKQLKLGVTVKTAVKVLGDSFSFTIPHSKSKAYESHYEKLEGVDITATTKMDGVRFMVLKEDNHIKAYTRSLKEFIGYEHILNEFDDVHDGFFEGEIIVENHREIPAIEARKQTASIVNSDDGDKERLVFVVFDSVKLDDFKNRKTKESYVERYERIKQLFNNKNNIEVVDILYRGNDFNNNYEGLMDYCRNKELEGMMVNVNEAVYPFGETDTILKCKMIHSIDLKAVEVYEGENANKGKLGGVVVKYKGFPVKIGMGWTKEEREHYFEFPENIIGKIIEIEYNGESSNKKGEFSLSHPRKTHVRYDKDTESYE